MAETPSPGRLNHDFSWTFPEVDLRREGDRRGQKAIKIHGVDHRKPWRLDGYQGQRLAPTIFIFLPRQLRDRM
jgi:hypothetical protein